MIGSPVLIVGSSSDPSQPEVIVAGRQSSSARNQSVAPFVFAKSGAATVAALPERQVNSYDVPLRVRKVVLTAGTAPAGSALVVDVKINGTSVFNAAGDRASIAAGAQVGSAVPTKTDLDAISVKPGQYVTAEVTAVGSGTAGSDLRVAVHLG